MSKPVKISVIIPVYNVEKYLYLSLGSCRKQTLRDVEFICVNDGSTDNSLEILRLFAEEDDRFVIIDKENGGVSSARNAGLDAANGEFIMFLDADDSFEENACERVWQENLEAPTDIVIFSSNVFPTYPRPISWYYTVLRSATKRYWEFTPKALFDEPSTRPFLWHQAFRKRIIDENNIRFAEDLDLGEDTMFILSYYPHANYFAFIPDMLHNYRWFREDSAMFKAATDYDKKITDDLVVVEKICEYWQKQGWTKEYPAEFLGWIFEFVCYTIRENKSDKTNEHYKKLAEIICKYGLKKSVRKCKARFKRLARPVKNFF